MSVALVCAPEAPAVPERLSPSSSATFTQCPRRWRFRYVERLPDPPGVPALVGTLAHRVLELLCQEPARLRDRQRARALAALCWPEMVANPDFAQLGLSADGVRAFKWRVWRAVEGLWCLEDPASVAVAATEQRVEVTLGGVPFVGVVDRVDDGPDGTVVTDYKSGRPPSLDRPGRVAEKLHQVLLYAAALEAGSGCRPARARLLYLGATVVEVDASVEATGAAVDALVASWGRVQTALAADRFDAQPGYLCGWCPYVDRCREGSAWLVGQWSWAERHGAVPALAAVTSWPIERRQRWRDWALNGAVVAEQGVSPIASVCHGMVDRSVIGGGGGVGGDRPRRRTGPPPPAGG